MEPFKLESSFLNAAEERKKKLAQQQAFDASNPAPANNTSGQVQAANTVIGATGAGSSEDTSTSGNALSGAGQGASAGAAFGPKGAAIGAAIGGVAGAISAGAKRKQKKRKLEADALRNNSQIEQNAGLARSNAIQSLAANISASLLGR